VITLQSIRDEDSKGYEFDPSTGLYQRIEGSSPIAGTRGFADIRMVGLREKEEVFAAIYSFENRLHVAIPPHHFTWPGALTAHRRTLFSRIKSFSIRSRAVTLLHLRYSFIDSRHEFPGPEAADIFYMIAWKTASNESVRHCIRLWEGMARGEDIASPDFQERLKEELRTES
jgi:hypothetical protein